MHQAVSSGSNVEPKYSTAVQTHLLQLGAAEHTKGDEQNPDGILLSTDRCYSSESRLRIPVPVPATVQMSMSDMLGQPTSQPGHVPMKLMVYFQNKTTPRSVCQLT